MRKFKILWIWLIFVLFVLPAHGLKEISIEKEWWYEKLKRLSIEEKLKNGFPDFDYIKALVEFSEKYMIRDENIKNQIFEEVRSKILSKIKELSIKYPKEKNLRYPYIYCLESNTCGTGWFTIIKIDKNYYLIERPICYKYDDFLTKGSVFVYDINNNKILYLYSNKYYGDKDENLKFILKIMYFLGCPEISCPQNFQKYCKAIDLKFFNSLKSKKDKFSQCYFFLLKDVPHFIDTKWIREIYIVTSGIKILKVNNQLFLYLDVCKIHNCGNNRYQILYEPANNNCFGKLIIKLKDSKTNEIIKTNEYLLGELNENIKLLFKYLTLL
jgi:hypothetical protein